MWVVLLALLPESVVSIKIYRGFLANRAPPPKMLHLRRFWTTKSSQCLYFANKCRKSKQRFQPKIRGQTIKKSPIKVIRLQQLRNNYKRTISKILFHLLTKNCKNYCLFCWSTTSKNWRDQFKSNFRGHWTTFVLSYKSKISENKCSTPPTNYWFTYKSRNSKKKHIWSASTKNFTSIKIKEN